MWVSQWPTLCIPSATEGPDGTNKHRCGLNSFALVPSMGPTIQSVASMASTSEETFRCKLWFSCFIMMRNRKPGDDYSKCYTIY